MDYNFPTLGELVKFAFDATGVLPRKRGEVDGFDDAAKKRIQKQLERLTDEDGSLTERCGELISTLAFLTGGAIPNEKANLTVGECAMDLFDVYNAVIRDEGTYLNKKDSILWFCRAHAIPRLALSIQKHVLRLNLHSEGFTTPPDPDWFLPTINEDEITWPLAKAMSWVYEACTISRTHFHYPGKSTETDRPEQQQNLDNASAWFNGKRLPSWPGLYWNFSRSMESLQEQANPACQRTISKKLRESIYQVLFLARMSTHVCSLLRDAYGPAALQQLITQFKQHRTWLLPDIESFVSSTTAYIEERRVPSVAVDELWLQFSERYWVWFRDRFEDLAHTLDTLLKHHDYRPLPEETINELVEYYGEYCVRTVLENIGISGEFQMPPSFPQRLGEGFELKGHGRNCTDDDVDKYLLQIQRDGLTAHLAWMERWLRAVVRYRKEEYESAFYHMEFAFERAKYCAGKSQYLLVNQFVELAAKTDRWKSFKKGVEWAKYLGIQIRWLRDDEPTEEALRFVFFMMQKAKYSQL